MVVATAQQSELGRIAETVLTHRATSTPLLIRMKRYSEAETYTRTSLALFEEFGDDYGCSLAKRNLVSILSESQDNDEEVRVLLESFQETERYSENLRERA